LHVPTGKRKIKKKKKKKSEGKEVKTKTALAALAAGHVLQLSPQCSELLHAWMKDECRSCALWNFHEQFHRRQEEREHQRRFW